MSKKIARNIGSFLVGFVALTTAVFAWVPGLAPQSAPGAGNVEINAGKWSANGSSIYFNSGNVGIGTTAPLTKFHARTGTSGALTWLPSVTGLTLESGGTNVLQFMNTAASEAFIVFGDSGLATAGYISYRHPTDQMFFKTAGTYSFNNGNVGIGTTNPSQKLDVAGNIRSTGGYLINNSSPTIYLQDTNHRSAMIHTNSNYFYILRGSGTNSTSWASVNGRWPLQIDLNSNNAYFGRNIYASAFYDYDNTGYYVNPAGTSKFNGINLGGVTRTSWPSVSETDTLATVLARGKNAGNREMVNVNGIRFGSSSGPGSWQLYGNGNMYTSGYWRGDAGLYVGNDEYFYRNSEDFIRTGDHFQSDASIRAPIFYDSNNTGYYINPAGTSRTGRINADNLFSYGWLYGTIFYDRNDSRYYVDPASTSRMNAITPNSIRLGGVTRTSWPSSGITSETDPQVGTLYSGRWCTSNGSTVNCTSSAPSVSESDTLQSVTNRGRVTSQYMQSNSSMRAPIFYDTNVSYYYVDPDKTSKLNTVITRNLTSPFSTLALIWTSQIIDSANSSYYIKPYGTSYFHTIKYRYQGTWSDIRLKKDIGKLDGSLDKILKLKGISFKWKDDELQGDRTNIGLIAQDVEKVYPELVLTDEENGMKTVQYSSLVAPLIEAIKEQQSQIDELRNEIRGLKN